MNISGSLELLLRLVVELVLVVGDLRVGNVFGGEPF